MDHSSRRDLLAGLASLLALPAAAQLPVQAGSETGGPAAVPATAPGQLRVNPPTQSVKRRG